MALSESAANPFVFFPAVGQIAVPVAVAALNEAFQLVNPRTDGGCLTRCYCISDQRRSAADMPAVSHEFSPTFP